jgi:DNA-directed RNA polymerase specialized sigma24 family protein
MMLSTQEVFTEVVPETLLIGADSESVAVVEPRPDDFYSLSESEVVVKFDPLIHKLINRKLHGFESSDVCEERDDIVQQCRMHILMAYRERKFDPSRGSKFESYIYMLLDSRLGNYRNKVTRKNENGTVSLSEIDGWQIVSGNGTSADNLDPYNGMADAVSSLSPVESSIVERLDAQNLLNRLTGLKKILYKEYYIEGLSVLEIHQRHPEIKYHKIRRELRLVIQFHNTLVRGE